MEEAWNRCSSFLVPGREIQPEQYKEVLRAAVAMAFRVGFSEGFMKTDKAKASHSPDAYLQLNEEVEAFAAQLLITMLAEARG